MAKPPAKPAAKPAKTLKNEHITVWLSGEQKTLMEHAASLEDEDSPGAWLRKLGLKRAREVLGVGPGDKVGRG